VIIDCDRCAIRGVGCSDCVISVLLDAPGKIDLVEPELKALGALADAGLVPRLRLVPLESTDKPADKTAPKTVAKTADTVDESVDTRPAVTPSAERSTEYVGRHRRQVS
jgi:hypothetical protein